MTLHGPTISRSEVLDLFPTLSPDGKVALLYELNRPRLEELASRATAKGYNGKTAIVVCIQVDSDWRPMVDILMPGADWQRVRDEPDIPLARGWLDRAPVVDLVSRVVPDLRRVLRRPPPSGFFHALICVEGRASLFQIEPRGERS